MALNIHAPVKSILEHSSLLHFSGFPCSTVEYSREQFYFPGLFSRAESLHTTVRVTEVTEVTQSLSHHVSEVTEVT